MMKLENLIGMNARAALIPAQRFVMRTVKSIRMTDNGKVVPKAKREKLMDKCTIKDAHFNDVITRKTCMYFKLETPEGKEMFVIVNFRMDEVYVENNAETVQKVENAETETKVEEKTEEFDEVVRGVDERIMEILNRPENAYYLDFARTMKRHGELNDRRVIKTACSIFDRPKLFQMALKIVASE